MTVEIRAMPVHFQDPLLNGFSRIPLRQNSQPTNRGLILKMADTILEARTHPKPTSVFSKSGDHVLESVFELLDRERYHLSWSKVVILGCSAGGNVALRSLFKNLIVPHLPIIVAMHHNPGFRFITKFEMANATFQHVLPAKDGEPIRGSKLYFLPGEMETSFSSRTKSFSIRPIQYKPRFRPDIDQVFTAAGTRFRENVTGIILSGMLNDGAKGAKAIALNKGAVWVQQPSTAMFKEMPNAAIQAVPSSRIKSLQQMAEQINKMSQEDMAIESIRKLWV